MNIDISRPHGGRDIIIVLYNGPQDDAHWKDPMHYIGSFSTSYVFGDGEGLLFERGGIALRPILLDVHSPQSDSGTTGTLAQASAQSYPDERGSADAPDKTP